MADQKISELNAKATPIDADLAVIVDTEETPDETKKVTWANVKATLKSYFDTLYRLAAADHTHASTGAQAGQLTNPLVNEAVALSATATNLNLTDDTDFLMTILKRQLFFILNTGSGNTVVNTGSAGGNLNRYYATSGTTASSTAIVYSAGGLYVGAGITGTNVLPWDWAKKATFMFSCMRTNSDAEAVGYIQFKTNNAIGALIDSGIGLKFANYQIWAESYGSSGNSTDTGVTMTTGVFYKILIEHDPTVPNIKFYVDIGDGNGFVLKVTEEATAKIPQALDTTLSFRFTVSMANGATGTVNAQLDCGAVYATVYDQ